MSVFTSYGAGKIKERWSTGRRAGFSARILIQSPAEFGGTERAVVSGPFGTVAITC